MPTQNKKLHHGTILTVQDFQSYTYQNVLDRGIPIVN